MMGERKKNILKVIIDDYVTTGEPVGSRTISKKYDFGLSAATIRNEMSDLEELGFLRQPHTSSGRIPSDKGYRLYVDELMNTRKLSKEEVKCIQNILFNNFTAMEQIIRKTTAVLSLLTNYTTIAVAPSIRKNIIKHIQIIPVDNISVLLILVTETGMVRNNLLRLSQVVDYDFITKFSNILNDKLYGLTLDDITLPIIQEIQKEMKVNKGILMPILDIISNTLKNIEDDNVYFDGASNILNYPEYSDTSKAKEFLDLIKTKEVIYELLKDNQNKIVRVSIGKENSYDKIDDCSLVSTTYSIGNKPIGTVGVIGPKRMDYSKVVSTLNSIDNYIGKLFKDWNFD